MSINKQFEILNTITQIMYDSTDVIYDELIGEFEYSKSDEGFSVGCTIFYKKMDQKIGIQLIDKSNNIFFLLEELHNLMQAHTGGNWTSFTLTLTAEGKATTKFNYDPIEEE